MKIETVTSFPSIQHDVPGGEKKGSHQSINPSADTVNLSPKALDYQNIKDALEADAETGAKKAAQITSSIQNNTYNVDSGAIADKLMNSPVIDIIL